MKRRIIELTRKILPNRAKNYVKAVYRKLRFSRYDFGNVFDVQTREIKDYGFTIRTYRWDAFTNTHIDLYGIFDPFNSQIVWENLDKKDVFIDVGAHTGWYSLLALKKHVKKVLAFEPNPLFFKLLSENLKQFDNAFPFPFALGNRNRVIEFFISGPENTGNSSISMENVREVQKVYEKILVPMMTLDTVVDIFSPDIFGSPIFLKIDVEGAEPRVLSGATNTIKNTEKIKLLIEFVPWKIKNLGSDPFTFLKYLTRLSDFSKIIIVAPDLLRENMLEAKPSELSKILKDLYIRKENKKGFKVDLFLC